MTVSEFLGSPAFAAVLSLGFAYAAGWWSCLLLQWTLTRFGVGAIVERACEDHAARRASSRVRRELTGIRRRPTPPKP